MTDVYDTSHCPLADRCEWCGDTHDLAVEPVATPVGVACTTSCGTGPPAGLTWPPTKAHARVALHAGHLGITLDEAVAATEGGAS